MTKILHLIETGGPGGAENLLLSMAAEYERRGIAQLVGLRKDTWLASKVRELGVELWTHPLTRRIDFAWLSAARDIVREHRVTAIHAHEFTMTVHGSLLAFLTGVRCISTIHGRAYYGEKSIRRLLFRLCSMRCLFVGVSNDICAILRDKVGLKPDSVKLIRNGIDVGRYAREQLPTSRQEYRQRLNIDEGTILIGTVGSLYEVKGHRFLIDAAGRLGRTRKDSEKLRFLIVGQGKLESQLRSQIDELGVAGFVELAGFRDDIPDLLQALDLFVLPSLSEGLPLCLLEAGAAGVPIVATSVGGVPEFLDHGRLGWLCEAGDADALASAIQEALDDESAERANLMQAAVRRQYSLESMASEYLALYG